MSKKLKLGIIGTGGIYSWGHSGPLAKNPDVETIALCDIVKEKAQEWGKKQGISKVVADYRDLLKVRGLEAVDICTPNLYHSEIAVAALEKGLHVFCEKPDAVSVKEAQRMLDAAKASGKTLMVMRNNRYNPASQFLKRYIAEGHAGEIYAGRCGWIRRRGIPGKGGWFTTKALSGGGPLIDLGVHFIDLAIWLMGNPTPVAVMGATYNKFASADISDSIHSNFGTKKAQGTFDVEDLAMGMIRFANGAVLQIEFSWASNIPDEKVFVELRGTKAGIVNEGHRPVIYSEVAGRLTDTTPRIPSDDSNTDHGRNLYHFVDVVRRGVKPDFEPIQGLNMIKILSAIYESAQTGHEVRM